MIERPLTVIKFGGSVLVDRHAYSAAAQSIGALAAAPDARVVVVVSAQFGATDALFEEARHFRAVPDQDALDLLWSTGELRSVALLTLALRAHGVAAAALNVHEAGLQLTSGRLVINDLAIRAALAARAIAIVPGFLARCGDRFATLGRGGSDLTAVQIATHLAARDCVLVKDVDGYFTADPKHDARALRIPTLTHAQALHLARTGCPLVQEEAIAHASETGLTLIVRALDGVGTRVLGTDRTEPFSFPGDANGLLNANDSRRAADRTAHRRCRVADLPDHDVSADCAR